MREWKSGDKVWWNTTLGALPALVVKAGPSLHDLVALQRDPEMPDRRVAEGAYDFVHPAVLCRRYPSDLHEAVAEVLNA